MPLTTDATDGLLLDQIRELMVAFSGYNWAVNVNGESPMIRLKLCVSSCSPVTGIVYPPSSSMLLSAGGEYSPRQWLRHSQLLKLCLVLLVL